jgi:hypothetical protein
MHHLEALKLGLLDQQEKIANLQTELKMSRTNYAADTTITLNLRGKVFKTYKETLLKKEGTFFYNMLSSGEWLPDEKGEYFIDRGPEGFERILEYLNSGELNYKGLNEYENKILQANLDYFQFPITIIEPLRWSTVNLPYGFILNNNDKSVTCTDKDSFWRSLLTTNPADQFKIRADDHHATTGFEVCTPCDWTDANTGTQYKDIIAWYFYAAAEHLYAITKDNKWHQLASAKVMAHWRTNSIIAAMYDRVKHEIRFEVDGHDIGGCFKNVTAEELFPTVCIWRVLTVTLVE